MPVDAGPRVPARPLCWPNTVLDLPDLLVDYTDKAYLVGGAVRDALLGRPITDIDLTTDGSGTRLARLIANRLGGAFYPLDAERDVGRALVETPDGQIVFDAASLRGPDLVSDLLDRDFTLNAMAVDVDALDLLIDPLGGERDSIDRVLRQCSPASLASDPLRTLRAVRQSVQLHARIEGDTLSAIRAAVPNLRRVSPERIRDEFIRILALPGVVTALRVATALGLLRQVLPDLRPTDATGLTHDPRFDDWARVLSTVEALAGIIATISPQRTDATAAEFRLGMIVMALDRFRARLQAHIAAQWPDERPHRALLMLAALVGAAASEGAASAQAEQVAHTLRLSNAERVRLVQAARHFTLPLVHDDLSPVGIYRFWKASGESGVDSCLLALAHYLGTAGTNLRQDAWIAVLERVRVLLDAWYEQRDQLVEPPVLVDGTRLMAEFRLRSGPRIGQLLEQIREAQVRGEVVTSDDALALARKTLEQG